MKTWTNPMRRRRMPTVLVLLAAVVGCEGATPPPLQESPWMTVLAEEVLSSHDMRERVSERPIVNIATAAGLEHHAETLSLVHGAVDRETRPRYVLSPPRYDVGSLPQQVPTEEPATPLPHEERFILGPLTLALDAVEVDTETRKVAVLTVFKTTVPYVGYDGRTKRYMVYRYPKRDHAMLQYRVEGRWDGRRWVANVITYMEALPEYSPWGCCFGRHPDLYRPADMAPEELPEGFVR